MLNCFYSFETNYNNLTKLTNPSNHRVFQQTVGLPMSTNCSYNNILRINW